MKEAFKTKLKRRKRFLLESIALATRESALPTEIELRNVVLLTLLLNIFLVLRALHQKARLLDTRPGLEIVWGWPLSFKSTHTEASAPSKWHHGTIVYFLSSEYVDRRSVVWGIVFWWSPFW